MLRRCYVEIITCETHISVKVKVYTYIHINEIINTYVKAYLEVF